MEHVSLGGADYTYIEVEPAVPVCDGCECVARRQAHARRLRFAAPFCFYLLYLYFFVLVTCCGIDRLLQFSAYCGTTVLLLLLSPPDTKESLTMRSRLLFRTASSIARRCRVYRMYLQGSMARLARLVLGEFIAGWTRRCCWQQRAACVPTLTIDRCILRAYSIYIYAEYKARLAYTPIAHLS